MIVNDRLGRILRSATEGQAPSKEDCAYLLGLPAQSLEAGVLMATADAITRKRFGNTGMLLGQIGIDTAACPGNCGFCVFGKDHTTMPASQLPLDEIRRRAYAFA